MIIYITPERLETITATEVNQIIEDQKYFSRQSGYFDGSLMASVIIYLILLFN